MEWKTSRKSGKGPNRQAELMGWKEKQANMHGYASQKASSGIIMNISKARNSGKKGRAVTKRVGGRTS